jgi:hypothetical protein
MGKGRSPDSFPLLFGLPSDASDPRLKSFLKIYSCGDSFGLTPNSLLINAVQSGAEPFADTKVIQFLFYQFVGPNNRNIFSYFVKRNRHYGNENTLPLVWHR